MISVRICFIRKDHLTALESKLKRFDIHRFTDQSQSSIVSRLHKKLTSPQPIIRIGILKIVLNIKFKQRKLRKLTLSTQRSMSRRNLELAPYARNTGTPAIVSP